MNKHLYELTRETQILLEHHRTDPDCEDTWNTYLRMKDARDTEWLKHQYTYPVIS